MLNKRQRLAKTTDVKRTFAQGRVFLNPYLKIRFVKATNPDQKRFTVVVPLRVSKRAVVRNRLKRIIREFIRLNVGSLAPGDYVVEIAPRAISVTERQLLDKFNKLLLTENLLKNGENTQPT